MFAMPKGRGSHKNFEDLDALELKYDPDNKGKPPREKPEIAWFFTKGGLSPPSEISYKFRYFPGKKPETGQEFGRWVPPTPWFGKKTNYINQLLAPAFANLAYKFRTGGAHTMLGLIVQ